MLALRALPVDMRFRSFFPDFGLDHPYRQHLVHGLRKVRPGLPGGGYNPPEAERHMTRHAIVIGQTFATVTAEERFFAVAEAEVYRQRRILEAYIASHPGFKTTLQPLEVEDDAPGIVREMAAAAARVGVGPMAAVAGALAQYSVQAMMDAGARHVIFDNGGDIVLFVERPVVVGIFTADAAIRDIGLQVLPRESLFSICTSSGTVGHSLSFGIADAALVVARDGFLADAAATALGNCVKTRDPAAIQTGMKELLIDGVEGLLVVVQDLMLSAGDLPDIVRVNMDMNKISKG